ncbi:helicase with zinc finger domain 2-like isoform X4 [Dreissena polymorpha]|uniref:helicase with zinc finger domain 2-like isoform X3 n=1 Tax=Dreissena polymorpha TaxID=45954 RepID=UPI002264B800|nr:helicase with zinc finger domain 2-like isoform X3 [Dreissena polymorpha]XP_052254961.1 helicase with zinc finger domain 2-like isoform X4 [Dreissena polymorpha]
MDDTIINDLIAKGQDDLLNGRKLDAKRRAREALIRAELRKTSYLLEEESSLTERMLTDWFRECCMIFKGVDEYALSVRCFYLATLFDVEWTIETHKNVLSRLLGLLVQSISTENRVEKYKEFEKMFHEMNSISSAAEQRNKLTLSLQIDSDIIRQQKDLVFWLRLGPLNIWNNNNIHSLLLRIARSYFKLNVHSEVVGVTEIVLKDFGQNDNITAIEMSAKSLQALGQIQKSIARCRLGLNNAKSDEQKAMFLNLMKILEDQKSQESYRECRSWLKETNIDTGRNERKATPASKKHTRHRRPKARNPSFPTPEAAKEALDVELCIRNHKETNIHVSHVNLQNIAVMPVNLGKPQGEEGMIYHTEIVRNKRYDGSDTSSFSGESSSDDDYEAVRNPEDSILLDSSGADETNIDSDDAISLDKYETDVYEHADDKTDFYEQSKCLHKDEIPINFHEEELWVKNGLQLKPGFVNQFKPKKHFDHVYEDCENETELLEKLNSNPAKYVRCIIHHDGCHNAICNPVDKLSEVPTIHISGRSKIGRTFNEDEVLVEVLSRNKTSEEVNGQVLGVFRRNRYQGIKHPVFICTVDENGSHLLRPMCKTVPKIKISTSYLRSDYNRPIFTVYDYNERLGVLTKSTDVKVSSKEHLCVFLVVFITWSSTFTYPLGRIVKILPWGNTVARGLTILNMQHEVHSIYSKETIDQVNDLQLSEGLDEPSTEKQQNRMDCTLLDAFTIDPPGAEDLDDALSLECREDELHVGVHISDVTEYVMKDDAYDNDAKQRLLTFYPKIDRPRHMLPEPISTRKCSLLEGKRRLTLSVFYCFDKHGKRNQINTQDIVRPTVIKSRKQFSYSQAQSIIKKKESEHEITKIEKDLKIMFKIACVLRKQRLGNAMHASQAVFNDRGAEDNEHEAHILVEEFMILTNITVGKMLYKQFPECVPVRYQPPPSDENMHEFLRKNGVFIDVVANLQDRCIGGNIRGLHTLLAMDNQSVTGKHVTVPKNMWQAIKDHRIPKQMLMCDYMLPIQHVTLQDWNFIQERAGYICCNGHKSDADDCKHYHLDAFPYVHFTSPIRRFIDIVIHRLVHAFLNDEPCPYTSTEIKSICNQLCSKEKQAKEYSKNCQLLKRALELQTQPQMLQCYVEDVSTSGIIFCTPSLKNVTKTDRTLTFNRLEMGHKPELMQAETETETCVRATWRKRLYDCKGTAFKYPKEALKKACLPLNPNKNVILIPLATWAHMIKSALNGHNADFEKKLLFAAAQHSSLISGFDDVSTESVDLKDLKPCTKFSFDFKRGQVINIQMLAGPLRGIMVPKPMCLKLTDTICFCLLHTEDPVFYLSNYSSVAISKSFRNVTQYVHEWLPLILMESAASTVGCTNDNFCINNVNINFTSGAIGKFALSTKHCDERNIELSGIQRDESIKGDEEAYTRDSADVIKSYDWICIKALYPLDSSTSHNGDYWIAHGTITGVQKKSLESDKIIVSFKLTARSGTVPGELSSGNSKYSIEVLKKGNVDGRIEGFIKTLERSSECLPKRIAIKQRIPDLDAEYKEALTGIKLDLPRQYMPLNNRKQQEAINKAMRSRFTLIQGPPGTGKTNTGIKLLYLFDQINEKISRQRSLRKRVLFCGPSNKCVDLVAREMLGMGNYAPKFVRVYGKSLEAKDFPIPGKVFNTPKNLESAYDLRSVSLHHIIRQRGKPFAVEIKELDDYFKDNLYRPMPEKIKEYQDLIHSASENEITEYNIILCTTDVATNARLLKALQIQQLIVDEAGMCPEPKCLVPIIASKAEQVVLIGDHMQLRPIIKCKEAAELGMDTSLFERYALNGDSEKLKNNVNFTMLDRQYRMHPRICDLPSELFYEGRLQTARNVGTDKPLPIWPEHETLGTIPRVFVHLVGNEEMLTVSTEDGNEMSKSNAVEVDYVVELYGYLISQASSVFILSQYNAQCAEIKRKLRENYLNDEYVSTVVSSQGGEWDYVIFSTVRSLPEYKIEKNPTLGWCKYNLGFITDQNQVHVAITRARKGLVIVGNKHLLRCDRTWNTILEDYEHYGCIKTPQEFPPPNKRLPRREIMAREQAHNYRRHGETIYERGQATSYDGPIDETPTSRFRNRGGVFARPGYRN